MRNYGFAEEDSSTDTVRDMVQAEIEMINATADDVVPLTHCCSRISQWWKNYRWRMRHYFYLHLSVFFFNSLFCGLIVWLIEQQQQLAFIDCWFISATCVFTCGLQTYDFSLFTRASQIVLLLFTLISGITVSTIPAIIIKIYRIKRETIPAEERFESRRDDNGLPIRQFLSHLSLDPQLGQYLHALPNPYQLRTRSYFILIVLILSTCLTIYLLSFISIALWLKYQYDANFLFPTNSSKNNPFFASLVISITAFNQNGLSVWRNSLSLFVEDIFMNIVVMIIVMSGTSLFPAILRGIVGLCKSYVPWKYKIYFDYILLNNHRLSTVIFPSVQTRLYVTITILLQILGVAVAMILDYQNPALAMYSGGKRFMIFMFQTVNTRFAGSLERFALFHRVTLIVGLISGYATINISDLSAATLIVFTLLMGIKPQMLCAINETPFEMEWILLQTQQTLENKVSDGSRRPSVEIFLPISRMKDFLLRQGSLTKARAKQYFARTRKRDRIEETIQQLNEKRLQRRFSSPAIARHNSLDGSDGPRTTNAQISLLRMKLFVITFCRHIILSFFSLLTSTRTWLFIFVFLISTFEAPRMTPSNPTITVFRVFFEVISAFGGCGLSMGFSASSSAPSLAAVLSLPSRISLILVMCMGRHRGLLDSMKDQEEIEYSAQTIIDSWKQLTIHQYQQHQKQRRHPDEQVSTIPVNDFRPTPPLSTRF